MSSTDAEGTHIVAVNIAIASTVVYTVLLLLGSLIFFRARGKTTFSSKRRPCIAIFFLFAFSFMPTILFVGIVGAWICAAYDSLAGAVAFLIVPGIILFIVIMAWCAAASVGVGASGGTFELDGGWEGREAPPPLSSSYWQTQNMRMQNNLQEGTAIPTRVDTAYAMPYFPSPYEDNE